MPVFGVRYRRCVSCLFIVLCILVSHKAIAHTLRPAVATLELSHSGALDVHIKVNAEALLVGLGAEHTNTDDSPQAQAYNELRKLSSEQLTVAFDDFADDFLNLLAIESDVGDLNLVYNRIVVPETDDLDLSRDSVIELSARAQPAAQYLIWHWPEYYGSSVVRLTTPGHEVPVTAWLQPGQASDPLQIAGMIESPSTASVVVDYIELGFRHILPLGLDHILFVLGLFLLSTHFRQLLWQVSAFTLAHTITLGLSVYGVVSLSSAIVEPLIALSIAYVGIENCLSSVLKPWRIALVFAFGLLHGMGFAGVLGEIGLPEEHFFTALISFNAGVELGQLAVICLALVAVGFFRKRSWYRNAIIIPGSLLISLAGLYWTWERMPGLL